MYHTLISILMLIWKILWKKSHVSFSPLKILCMTCIFGKDTLQNETFHWYIKILKLNETLIIWYTIWFSSRVCEYHMKNAYNNKLYCWSQPSRWKCCCNNSINNLWPKTNLNSMHIATTISAMYFVHVQMEKVCISMRQ